MKPYDHRKIEKKRQAEWTKKKIYSAKDKSTKKKFYPLIEFPFPSGAGLHAGHIRSYTAMDIIARKRRMQSENVLYPMGWDAFGLPTENYALKTGISPKVATKQNTDNFRRQLKSLGFSFDWSREINTTDPGYYRWTQWIFLQMYKKGLAYKAKMEVNWCPKDKIVLANEEVIDGCCERCGTPVERRVKEQWMLAITKYADRLCDDLDGVDYSERIKVQQRNWIGRSEGAEIYFDDIKIFTTRPDTIYGATFIAVAGKENKFTGRYVTNPATKEKIPVWEADYVLADYGTGAIMGVPKHDERDAAFAEKYRLPLKDAPFADREAIEKAGGKWVTKFKLRDWIFSRQRYWGEPIPMIHCEKCGYVPVPEKDLPVKLPEVKKYQPTDTGESPLANISKWVNVKCPKCGSSAKRETDTMPNWAGSSWYYLRYLDPKNKKAFADRKKIDYFMPVDWYNGGMEHTTLHLLYSRFWHKFLFDEGLVNTSEPYAKRTSHGLILAEGGVKMSKSLGNIVSPDELVAAYGADTLRLYEMFIGPFDQSVVWNSENIIGPRRFIERVWKLQERVAEKVTSGSLVDNAATTRSPDVTFSALLHKTIKKVTEDIEAMGFNTAISSLMILTNALEKEAAISREDFESFLKILAPFAPHVAEEIWYGLGNKKSIHISEWPTYDASLIKDATVKIAVQVNGKTRAVIEIAADADEGAAKALALAAPEIQKWVSGKTPTKIIYVKGKIINFIVPA